MLLWELRDGTLEQGLVREIAELMMDAALWLFAMGLIALAGQVVIVALNAG